MKRKTKALIIGVGILFMYICIQMLPYQKDKNSSSFKRKGGELPLLIAHGGSKRLYPENTILAYERVMELGVDAFEVDIRMSKDKQLISVHDERIDAYTKEKGKVEEYTYEELKGFNFGYDFIDLEGNYPYREIKDERILNKLYPIKIEDMFKQYGDKVLYILEIKEKGKRGKEVASLLNQYITSYHLEDKVCVASFDEEVMHYFNGIKDKRISSSLSYEKAKSLVVANYMGYGIFKNYQGEGLQLPQQEDNIPLDDTYLIWKIHKNDMFVNYWTIDSKKEMKKLVERGVDGIISDRVDLLKEVLEEANE